MPALRIDPDRLQPALDALGDRVRSGRVSAGVVAVASSQGIIRAEGFGSVGGRPVGLDTRFFLASVTKPIVATAVVQLAAQGRIVLSEPLRSYLPELPDSHAAITPWHILTHTSGIPDDVFGDWSDRAPRHELVRRAATRPLDFAPGARYAYCSTSWYLLGELLARVDGVPFETSLRRRVLDPLAMDATSFSAIDPPGSFVAPDGLPDDAADPAEAAATLLYLASISLPGGGLWSTAGDLARFARAYLRGGRLDDAELLPHAWIDLMGREQTGGLKEASIDGCLPEGDPHYALGWGKPAGSGDIPCSERAIEHGGISGTRLFIDPIRDFAVVVLANRWDVAEPSLSVVGAAHSALASV
jgi:CubicO group peptidase (beta-lactamase class C family)